MIINDYSEYSGISVEEILLKCSNFKDLNKENFNNFQSTHDFYKSSDTYIFDLFNANLTLDILRSKINLFSPGLMDEISQKPSGVKFLEFGGGLGVFCELVKSINPNIEVTYCDIKTKISDFTLWRFEKYKSDIKTLIIPQGDFSFEEKYDMIFSDAVIEHLPQSQQEIYVRKLSSYLNKNGSLYLIIDLEGENPDMPMHFNVDIIKLHSILEFENMTCVYGKNNFSSRWVKN